MIGAISNALGGLTTATRQVNQAANNIAGAAGGNVDLAKEAVDLKLAEASFKANLSVMRTADDMNRDLLDILA